MWGLLGSWIQPVVIYSVPEYIIGVDVFSSWQSPRMGSLDYGVIANIVGKAKWKPLTLSYFPANA